MTDQNQFHLLMQLKKIIFQRANQNQQENQFQNLNPLIQKIPQQNRTILQPFSQAQRAPSFHMIQIQKIGRNFQFLE